MCIRIASHDGSRRDGCRPFKSMQVHYDIKRGICITLSYLLFFVASNGQTLQTGTFGSTSLSNRGDPTFGCRFGLYPPKDFRIQPRSHQRLWPG